MGCLFSSFMAGKYKVGVGDLYAEVFRGKLFAVGVQKGQSHH